jgi:hypothetical protein
MAYHVSAWFDPTVLPGKPDDTYGGDVTAGPVATPQASGDPTFHGYSSDNDPDFPGAE